MNKSDEINELATALTKVQSKLEGAKMDGENPFFKAKYASLSSVWDACRKPLTDNGLSVVQTCSVGDSGGLVIDTTLLHTSGQWISGELALKPAKDDPQGVGSAITYARRYGLASIIGICPEDDDAESATERKLKPALGKAKPVKVKVEPTPATDSDDTPSVDKLYQWIADNMKWKKPTAAKSWIVNKCKIAEERIETDTEAVKEEIRQLMDWQPIKIEDK